MVAFKDDELFGELYHFMLVQQVETELIRGLLFDMISKTKNVPLETLKKMYYDAFEKVYRVRIENSPFRDEFDEQQMEALLKRLKEGL